LLIFFSYKYKSWHPDSRYPCSNNATTNVDSVNKKNKDYTTVVWNKKKKKKHQVLLSAPECTMRASSQRWEAANWELERPSENHYHCDAHASRRWPTGKNEETADVSPHYIRGGQIPRLLASHKQTSCTTSSAQRGLRLPLRLQLFFSPFGWGEPLNESLQRCFAPKYPNLGSM